MAAISGPQGRFEGRFRPVSWPSGRIWTHSSPHLLQQRASHHPQVGQRKQRHHVGRVLGQAFVPDLGEAELALDDPKRVFYLGPDAGLEFFQLLDQAVAFTPGVQRLAFTRRHGHMPGGLMVSCLDFLALVHTPVTGVGKDIRLLPVQQRCRLGDVVCVGGGGAHGVHEAGVGIDTDMNTKGLPASK